MADKTFVDDMGLPEELVPLLVHETWVNVCEFASIKRDGTPVTVPLGVFPGEKGRTIGISARLAFPSKAERVRKNPKVCLLYSEPKGSPVENPPVILVYGHATVRDADLQANLDRFAREQTARVQTFRKMPSFMLRWMSGFLAAIWIEVTPLKILWWPDANLEKPAQQWHAPEGIFAPPSDPPPKPRPLQHKPVVTPSSDWRQEIAYAFNRLGSPILTVVDRAGYPVQFRARSGVLQSDGVRLDLPPAMPAEAKGGACLTFHTIQVKNGEMVANENRHFIGDIIQDGAAALFRVERQLPSLSAKFNGPGDVLSYIRLIRASRKRAKAEAARRGQPMPKI